MGRGTPAGLGEDREFMVRWVVQRPQPGLGWRVVVRWASP